MDFRVIIRLSHSNGSWTLEHYQLLFWQAKLREESTIRALDRRLVSCRLLPKKNLSFLMIQHPCNDPSRGVFKLSKNVNFHSVKSHLVQYLVSLRMLLLRVTMGRNDLYSFTMSWAPE